MNGTAAPRSDDVPEFAAELPFDESALDTLKGSYSVPAVDAGDAPACVVRAASVPA